MLKIKSLAGAMILVLACATIGPPTYSQARRRAPKRKPATPTAKADPQATTTKSNEADVIVQRAVETLEKEIRLLSGLTPENKTRLRTTTKRLARLIKTVRLGGFPEYFLSDLSEAAKVEKEVNQCLAFLPDGITRNSLLESFQALLASWHLDWSMKTGIVDDRSLAIVEEYKLEVSSGLYSASREVLAVAELKIVVASAVADRIAN